MSVEYMNAIRQRYERLGYAPYRWFVTDEAPPWTPLSKPLSASKLGLLSTSGAYAVGQVAYHYKDDTSIREIPSDTAPENIRFSHITENYLVDPKKDPDCILPLREINQAADAGIIGSVANDVMSCMGGVYSQRRVREETAPAVLDACRRQDIDCALLVAM